MYTVEDKLKFCATTIGAILADLKLTPEKVALVELLDAVRQIDKKYQNLLEQGEQFNISLLDWEPVTEALSALDKTRSNL